MDKQTESEVVVVQETPPPKTSSSKLPLLLAFLALLGSAASLGIGYQIAKDVRQEHSSTNQEIKQLSNSREENQNQVQQAQQTVAENSENIKKIQADLVSLGTSLQEVTEANQAAEKRLRYSEVDYATRLAQLNLHFQKNQATAISLLEYADEQLRTLNDPNSVAFREKLSHQIADLKALPAVDTTGILSQISAMNAEVISLPILSVNVPKAEAATETQATTDEHRGFWKAVWETSLDQLKHFVTIRRLDQPIKPLLAEADQALLTRTIQYLFQQAAWAVTQQNTKVYQSSLADAENLIRTHYNVTASNTESVLTQIKQLQDRKIQLDLPDISALVAEAGQLRPRVSAQQGTKKS